MPKFTAAIVIIMKYKANINLMIRVNVLGVCYSVKEWKLRNSAMLAVEEPTEPDEEPVAL